MTCAQGLLRLLWGGSEVGVLRDLAYQEFSKLSYCTTQQVFLHSFGSFSADERELRERHNSANCSQVRPIHLGGHWRF